MVDEVIFFVIDFITLVCLFVRIFVRYRMTSSMEMDDWVVVSMVPVWAAFLGLGHYSTDHLPLSTTGATPSFCLRLLTFLRFQFES